MDELGHVTVDRLRERVTGAVDVEIDEVASYDVAFADFTRDVGRSV